MPSELISLQNKVTQLESEALSYQKAMNELHHRIDIQDATNEILNISLMPVSLEEQMESILLLVLNISWLALEGKGCIFLTDEQGQGLNMIAHHNLGQSLLTMCKQVPFGSCLCGKAAIDQSLIFRDCVDKDHHYHPEGMQPHGHYNMPILSRGKTLGILNLYVKHGHQQEQLELDFLDACGKALAGIIERKLIEKELYRLSYMDELTGVANRRKFMETLSGALKLSQHVDRSLAVLFLDLDFFKAVNDTHGHEYGDKVLIEAAQRMQACIRDTDIIARLGGDEFVILLEMILAPKGAISIAEKLIQAISKPYNIKGKSISIGVSIGISLYPVHDTSAEGLLKKADQALYGAKENRGKVVLFSTE